MKKDFLALFRTHAAGTILSYVDNHQNTQYKDLLQFSTPYSMNRILRELQNWGFIKCFCDVVTGDNRVELTERGKTVLEMLRELARMMEDDSPDTENGPDEVFPHW